MSSKPLSLRYIVTATLLGNTLEWYDFATFGFLIPLFAKLFFPAINTWEALVHTMIAFTFGAIMRPIGGILFGYIGDRYGRRVSLILSISLMTIPATVISFLPTYLQIGIAAPMILTAMRILQGIAAGGELPGAVTFLVESSAPRQRGFYGSFAFFGVALGLLLGGCDFFFFGSHLSNEDFAAWGWRLVFIVGALLGLVTFLMRRKLHETHVFQTMKESHEILQDPIRVLFAKYKKRLAQLCGLTILETVGYNLIIPFSLVYLTDVIKISFHHALRLNLLRLGVILLVLPFAGMLASRVGPKRLAVWVAWCFLILPLPFHWLMHIERQLVLASIGLAVLQGCYMAAIPATIAALFPARVRFCGIGIAYNTTVGIVGGFTPLATLSFIHSFGTHLAPALLLIAAALIALITLRSIRNQPLETHH